jgi:hypothetical protein
MNQGEELTAYPSAMIDENRFRIMASALGSEIDSILKDAFQDCEDFTARFPVMAALNDVEGIRVLCHALKGVLGMLGLVGLGSCLEAWEGTLMRGEIPPEESVLKTFRERLAATHLALRSER